jgi:hypothetical protein
MTAIERALVVFAAAKGYEIEYLHKDSFEWNIKETGHLDEVGYFNFDFNKYRIMNKEDFRKVHDELSDFFKPLYTPEKKRTWNIEDLKKVPRQGFSCKTVTLTREEIEEMNKPKEKEFDVKKYVKSLVQTPEYLERCKEVNPIIEILEAYKNGENNFEIQSKTSTDEGWKPLEDKPSWNFGYVNYRISPKQPEAIQATEEELEEVKSEPKPCFWIKDKKTGITWKLTEMGIGVMQDFYIFDKQTKTWQDWGSK